MESGKRDLFLEKEKRRVENSLLSSLIKEKTCTSLVWPQFQSLKHVT
jgi:hypothetical protein